MNVYCECANRTTLAALEKNARSFVAVNKNGEVVRIGGQTMLYRSEINGEEVTVYASNVVPHERNYKEVLK